MHTLDKELPSILSGQIEWHNTFVDDRSTQVGGTQVLLTHGGYMLTLVSRGGLTQLEFIGTPTNEDFATYPLVHLPSPHIWDPTMLDALNPYHSLTTD